MIDVLKNELKRDMSIGTEKELSSKWKVTILYNGMQSTIDLPKTCTPGCEKEVCRKAIDTALSTMYINAGNLTEAKKWLDGEFWKEDTVKAQEVTIREFVNIIKENRDRIAMNLSYDIDYYSFLKGFDYVLDEINCVLNNDVDTAGVSISYPYNDVYFIINQGTNDAWVSSKPTKYLSIWEIEGIDKDGHYFSTKEKAEMLMK